MHRHGWNEPDTQNQWLVCNTANKVTSNVFSLEDDGDLLCQAGARWEDINSSLKERGIPLFFPVSEPHAAGEN